MPKDKGALHLRGCRSWQRSLSGVEEGEVIRAGDKGALWRLMELDKDMEVHRDHRQ